MTPPTLVLDGDRIVSDLAALAEHGRSPSGGWTRQALSPSDAAARRIVIERARAMGLEVRRDEVGNLHARLVGREPELAPVLTGSHLDSVPSGGRLDGPLGVVGALAAVEAMARAGVRPRRSVEVVVFVGEEGSRFPRGTIGSAAVAGHVNVVDILALRDAEGISYGDALATYADDDLGPPVAVKAAANSIHAFLELHIEQGGVLESARVPVGAVTAINGLTQIAVTFTGDANHAGATPMGALRRDALAAASAWVLAVEKSAIDVGGGAVATVGKMDIFPGGKNIIPGRVEAICDLRAATPALLAAVEERVVAALARAADRGVEVAHRVLQRVTPGPMHERAISAVEAGAAALGLASLRMPSGAIHDALHMADVAPSSMVFVPSRGGKSHCPEEDTAASDLVTGARVLAEALWILAEQE